jgi:Ca2+-binding RTX toxin-like protein
MLEHELLGKPYNKTEHRKDLLPRLDNRKATSIEFKHASSGAITPLTGTTENNGGNNRWIDGSNTLYQFTPRAHGLRTGMLNISHGVLGATDRLIVNDFDLARAQTEGGFLGIRLGTEKIALISGTRPNPFDDAAFDPDSALVPTSELREERAIGYTVYLPYTVGRESQEVKLTFDGDEANLVRVVVGDDLLIPENGEIALTLGAGEREKSFAILTEGDFDVDETISISAVLVDGGNATNLNHDEATLTLNAHQELAPQLTLSGGDGSDAYTQSEWDYVGQRVSISGGDGADLIGGTAREDTLDGGGGDDVIIGGGGQDAIAGGEGNDLITVSGDGAAHIDGARGDDVVDALRLIDGHMLPTDGGSPFGWRGVAPDILSHLHVVPQGDPRGNRADNAASGLPYAIELAPTSFSGTSSEIGLVGGQLAVAPGGGASYRATQGHSNNWLVTYTAGSQSRTFDFSFGLIGAAQNAAGVSIDGGDGNDLLIGSLGDDFVRGGSGNDAIAGHDGDDVVLGGAGADSVFAGEGNDFLDGGADDDVLFGEAGNDALYGGDGADHLEGDGAGTPVAMQGDDYLNGEGGDDELIGEAGSDVLIGGDGNDRLYGGDGADELVGGTGNDLLQGGDGNDTLDAGAGNDVLFGEAGDDSF